MIVIFVGSSRAWKETIRAVHHLPGLCLLEPDGRLGRVGGCTVAGSPVDSIWNLGGSVRSIVQCHVHQQPVFDS